MFGGSIQLGRIFGIRIGVDFSWFLVLFLIIWNLSDYYKDAAPGSNAFVLAVLSALLFFLSILLHELGHAWVAIRNGIPILGIDLWMFGGVAKLGRESTSPGVEFRIAVAGPLVTLAIAGLCFALGSAISSSSDVLHSSQFESSVTGSTTAVLGYLTSINVLLLAFNLIPAFPLDGGRIARAIAWKVTGDRNRATRFAATLGRLGGYGMIGARRIPVARAGPRGDRDLAGVHRLLPRERGTKRRGERGVLGPHRAHPGGRRDGRGAGGDPRGRARWRTPSGTTSSATDGRGSRWLTRAARLVGVVSREAVESVPVEERQTRTVASVMARDDGSSGLRVRLEEPLESLLTPGGPGAAGSDHGRGRRGRAARDRHRGCGAAGVAGAGVSRRAQLLPRPARALRTTASR